MKKIFLWFYSLRKLVLAINLIVLLLPLIGIATLRIFENFLHRQTEEELIAQGFYVRSLYLRALKDISPQTMDNPANFKQLENRASLDEGWRPYLPKVDVSWQPILPPAPEGKQPPAMASPAAQTAGTKVEPIIREAQLQNLSAVRILDQNGVVVATTRSEIGLDLSERVEVKTALRGDYASVMRERISDSPAPPMGSISRASRIRVFVAIPIIENSRLYGAVYLSRTSLSLFRALWEARYGAALAGMLGVTIVISLILSFVLTKPLKTMVRQAERIADGEKGLSLDTGPFAPAEARRLSHALSQMIETLESRHNFVREFSSNVSHEFKTPLTSIQGAIELLRENWATMNDSERERFMEIIDSESRRMERLVKRLFVLARIETASPSGEATDLVGFLKGMVHRYNEAGKNVSLVVETDSATTKIAPDMAEILFSNLIENGLTHGKGAPVTVTISRGPKIVIEDKGPGISESNMDRIFDRFFTTAREEGGTGLGLAMVKSIVQACGGSVTVKSDQTGTAFTVEFPQYQR